MTTSRSEMATASMLVSLVDSVGTADPHHFRALATVCTLRLCLMVTRTLMGSSLLSRKAQVGWSDEESFTSYMWELQNLTSYIAQENNFPLNLELNLNFLKVACAIVLYAINKWSFVNFYSMNKEALWKCSTTNTNKNQVSMKPNGQYNLKAFNGAWLAPAC